MVSLEEMDTALEDGYTVGTLMLLSDYMARHTTPGGEFLEVADPGYIPHEVPDHFSYLGLRHALDALIDDRQEEMLMGIQSWAVKMTTYALADPEAEEWDESIPASASQLMLAHLSMASVVLTRSVQMVAQARARYGS